MKKKRARKLARQVERAHALALNETRKVQVTFFHPEVSAKALTEPSIYGSSYTGPLIEGEVGVIDSDIRIITNKENSNG